MIPVLQQSSSITIVGTLTAGTRQIKAVLDDGNSDAVLISLR